MRRIICYFMLAFLSVPAMAQKKCDKCNCLNELPQIGITGKDFVCEGKTIRLKGVSMSDPDKLERAGHWNLDYFRLAKSWGCNVVRLPIHTYTWRYRGKKEYTAMLDQGVEWARQTGMYVILDWHAIGNLHSDAWPHFNYMTDKKETAEFWKEMALHYKGNTTVCLFELFNEPENEKKPLTWNDWREYSEQLIDTIRAYDNERLCAVAGMNWAYNLNEVVANPVKREGVCYVTHPYPKGHKQPWEPQWTGDWGHVADHYPVIATELGFVIKGERGEHDPVIGDETYGKAIMDYLRQHGISYTIWCLDPDWSPAMLDDYDGTPSPRQGVFFKNAILNGK